MNTLNQIYDVFDTHGLRGWFDFTDRAGRMSKARKRNIVDKLIPILTAAKIRGEEDEIMTIQVRRYVNEYLSGRKI